MTRVALGLLVLIASSGAPTARAQEPAPEPARAEAEEAGDHDPRANELDLAELITHAIASWPGLRASEHRIAAAEAQLDEAWISPFFQINATLGLAVAPETRGSPILSPDSQLPLDNAWRPLVRAGVEAVVPLWTFGKLDAARSAARGGIRAARADRERAHAQLRLDVRRAYFGLGLALDALEMIGEGQPKLERAVERIEERIENDDPSVNEMDRWRLASTIAEVLARASEARRLEASSRAALEVLTNVEGFTVPECSMSAVMLPERPFEWYLSRARDQRPELEMLRGAIDARRAAADLATARFFPDIGLALGASYSYGPGITDQNNPFIVDAANYTSLGAGIVARWSLDFLGHHYRSERAHEELAALEAQAEEVERGIRIEVSDLFNQVEDARRRVEAWGRGHRDGRAWFLAAVQADQIGAGEARDLVDAVRAYFTNRFNHMQAIFDLNAAVSKLERAVGGELIEATAWEPGCSEPAP